MRSLGCRCFLAASLIIPFFAPPARADGLRVLRSDAEVLEVEWTLEQPVLESVAGSDGLYRRPVIPGALRLEASGEPDVPSIVHLVGIPLEGDPRLEVVSVATSSTPVPDLAPVALEEPVPGEEGASPRIAARIVRSQPFPRTLTPEAWARLDGSLSIRGQRLTRLVLHPCRYDGAAGDLVWARRLVVRVHFGEGGRTIGRGRSDTPGWEAAADAVVLNAEVARRWRKPRAISARSGTGDSFDSSPNWLKIPIERRGAYWIDYFTFSDAGFHPADIDPTTIRVFCGTNLQLRENYDRLPPSFMTECALLDLGDSDSIFDLEDRFVFYALSPNGWAAEYVAADPTMPRTEYIENQYTDTSYYWVTWGGTFQNPPKRMATRDVQPGAGPFASTAPWRKHFEENNTDNFRFSGDDGWFWEFLQARSQDRPYFLRLENVASGSGVLTARVASDGTTDPDEGPVVRCVELKVQDEIVADSCWVHSSNYFPENPPTSPLPRGAMFDMVSDSTDRFVEGVNKISVNVRTDLYENSGDRIYTTWFDIEYERELVAQAGARCHMFQDPQFGVSDFLISGFDSDTVFLLDVTDQHDVVQLDYGALDDTVPEPRGLRFSDPGATDVRWYYAVSIEGVERPAPARIATFRRLRAPENAAEYLILHHPTLAAGARELADVRARVPSWSGRPIMTVDIEDVYNEFSWGMKDAIAKRDFLAYAHASWTGSPPLFVVFIGDAAYDTKGWLTGSPDNQIASFVNAFQRESSSQYDSGLNLNFYSTDDFFGYLELEDFESPGMQPALDVAIGRIPASDPAQLDVAVEKLEQYLRGDSPGQWLNRAIMVADDEVTPSDNAETIHTIQVETISQVYYPSAIDKVKIYLTEYAPNAFGKKPDAQARFLDEFTRGALVVNYSGHGDQNQLAQEEVFLTQKTPQLLNEDRLPVFTTFSCTVSRFDLLSGNSMTENLLFHSGGGIVTSFSSGGLVFPVQSDLLHRETLSHMFGTPYPVDTLARTLEPLGLATMTAKSVVGSNAPTRRNNEKYNILGDPALELRFGRNVIQFDSTTVNGSVVEGPARVIRGQIVDEDGNVLDGTGTTTSFDGTAFVHVTEDADTTGYDVPVGGVPDIDYTLEGLTVYRGEVPVRAGRFEAKFIVSPTVVTGNLGRVSVFALEDSPTPRDGSGAYDSLFVTPTPPGADDGEGPDVRIAFEGYENFVDGDYIFTGQPILKIAIADSNGVNLRPFPQFSRLEAEIDRRDRIDLSGDFTYSSGSFTRGEVRRIFPLGEGKHTIRVKAYDMLGNRGSDEVSFEIILDGANFRLDTSRIAFYPNPFQDVGHLLFSLTHEAEVSLKIFTINGRRVYEDSTPFMDSPGTRCCLPGDNVIEWNGRDENGNPLANGTYLYKLEATYRSPEGNQESDEFVGKVVKMR